VCADAKARFESADKTINNIALVVGR